MNFYILTFIENISFKKTILQDLSTWNQNQKFPNLLIYV